jgi:urease accessory protein UreH
MLSDSLRISSRQQEKAQRVQYFFHSHFGYFLLWRNGAGSLYLLHPKKKSQLLGSQRLKWQADGAIVVTVQADQGLASRDLDAHSQHLRS